MVRKGAWYAIEAILASSMVIMFLMIFMTRQIDYYEPDLAKAGYEELETLDFSGQLRQPAIDYNWTGINNLINLDYNHTVKICFDSCVGGSLPSNKNIISITYLISGNSTTYSPREIFLYLWEYE